MLSIDKKRKVPKMTYEEAKAKGMIDASCIPLCDYFNRIGFETSFCCQGHRPGEEFVIHFNLNVPDCEMMAFIQLVEKANGKGSRGKFVKWYRCIGGVFLANWIYIACGTPEEIQGDIRIDLVRFLRAEELGKELSRDKDSLYSFPE